MVETLYITDIQLLPILFVFLNIGTVAAIAFVVYHKFIKKNK